MNTPIDAMDGVLGALVAMIGQRVLVTVEGRYKVPPPVIVMSGVLSGADDLLDAAGDVHPFETFWLGLDGNMAPSGAIVYKEFVADSWMEGNVLVVPQGNLVTRIEPLGD